MSHFTVLVAANSLEELEAKLQPYHEYECTGIKDQYVVFVEADMEEAQKEWGEQEADYDSFDSFMEDWYGYELIDDKWGRHTNPNAKWDWWVIGGRWPDILLCKDGSKGDFALNKHIDWAGMKAAAKVEAAEKYRAWHIAKTLSGAIRERLLIEADLLFTPDDEVTQLDTLTEDLYSDIQASAPITFAFIDQAGEWHERAKMGWWGITTNHSDSAGQQFWDFVESLSPNQGLYVVDCHI